MNQIFESDHVREFFSDERFLHVYGSIGDPYSTDRDFDLKFSVRADQDHEYYYKCIQALDKAYLASKHLNVIDPHTKEDNSEIITAAAQAIKQASVVDILGYGFDKNNNNRLGMDKSLYLWKSGKKCVMFTNFRDSDRVNKAASRLFYRAANQIATGSFIRDDSTGRGSYCEKSTRDVYEALELDFDSLEDQFGAGSATIPLVGQKKRSKDRDLTST